MNIKTMSPQSKGCCEKCETFPAMGTVPYCGRKLECPCHTASTMEEWDEKGYVENLHFILGDMTEHKWKLALGLIQGKINHQKLLTRSETLEEVREKMFCCKYQTSKKEDFCDDCLSLLEELKKRK